MKRLHRFLVAKNQNEWDLNGCPAGMISSNEDLIRLMHIKEYIIEPWIIQPQIC